ncbi:MAG: GNAT family N-acetyltransferase [Gammaproteobacteria bacterium]|nr:GNAT family N-acetyltransferase [Gammaproteobacteria bacterium]
MSETETDTISVEVRDTLGDVSAESWNALTADDNPFTRYEFLSALETTGCLGEEKGWYPRYFLVFDKDDLIAACPTYVKTNSYGEFVFDWAWAEAYERNGLPYYPKLISSIPYTPATGRRLLIRADQSQAQLTTALQRTIVGFCKDQSYSGMHWLFVTEEEHELLEQDGLMTRLDCQYHWHNQNYSDFDDFLANCTSKRRKTIKRERRHVSDANIRLEPRAGSTLTKEEWRRVHRFYRSTFDQKWGSASLTRAFFETVGETMGDDVFIVFAYLDDPVPIACSIMFKSSDTLYGRFWGCSEEHHSLHFEACYYQGIEYCIKHGLKHFEPGAQGEHKITRGFVPRLTYSQHWIAHDGFRNAIENYLTEERTHVRQRCEGLAELLPFKQTLALDHEAEKR